MPSARTFVNVIKPLTGFTYRGLTPHKPFGLESFDPELTTEGLRAERFTPPDKFGIFDIPGVHNRIQLTQKAA